MNVKHRRIGVSIGFAALCVLCVYFFAEKHYTITSILVSAGACGVFYVSFERKKVSSRYAVLIAVMTALSVAGRFIFAPIPAFKPITAIVILSGIYLSAQGGFLTGALSALLSNIYFGHGAWTPFQMLAWGLIGFGAGLLAHPLKKYKTALLVYGAVSGAVYSLVTDIWSVLWYDNGFDIGLYRAAIISALPFTLTYAASNVIFLLLIADSFGRKLSRAVELSER